MEPPLPIPTTPLSSPLIFTVSHGCLDSERSALLQFKAGFNDPNGLLSSWQGFDCCRWRGVACDRTIGGVVKVDLRSPYTPDPNDAGFSASLYALWNLSGRIGPSLLRLESLRHLDLSGNNFQGIGIPALFGSFKELRYLNLSQAGFMGSIPPQLGNLTCLQYLDLSSVWWSPSLLRADGLRWISGLSSLRHLAMDRVDLSAVGSNWIQLLNERLPSLVELHLSLCSLPSIAATLHSVNFTSLEVIDLSGNFISSTIPNWLPNVTTLVHVNISVSGLHGPIPVHFSNLPNLELLDLSRNNIGGGMPASFGRLCKLTELTLSSNNLTGHLPEFLEPDEKCSFGGHRPSPLPRLAILRLGANSLVGKLPAWMFERTGLQVLSVSRNQFTGVVTEAHLSELRNLRVLGLSHNSLTLNISSDWIPPFQLERLYVASCQLGPKFPSWIKTQRELGSLDLSKNGISDGAPSWFWDLSSKINLTLNISFNCISGLVPRTWSPSPVAMIVDMSSNMLHGRLPPLTLPRGLWSLHLSANRFYGPIWPNIGEMMPNMSSLSLAGNYLSGEIPATIGEMHRLGVLDLSKNNLTGGIPTTLVNCSDLVVLNLGSNNLTGAIPTSFGVLTYLKILQLDDNLLSGEIPLTICNCSALEILDIGGNMLHGNIPTCLGNLQTLRVLRLRSNGFSGEMPWQLSNLRLLQVLDASENNLTGPIPGNLGSLRAMKYAEKLYSPENSGLYYYKISVDVHMKGQHLEYDIKTQFLVTSIDLSGNKLSGEFPESLVNLSSVVSVDLSRNLLTGTIPDTIGYMRQLQSLDLSDNHFSGKIPSSMASLTFLSFLNLSNNNFSGQIPAGGQLETFGDASFLGNQYLCGPFLKSHCPEDNLDNVGINKYVETCANDDFYMALELGFAFGILALCIILLTKKRWSEVYFEAVDRIVDKLF